MSPVGIKTGAEFWVFCGSRRLDDQSQCFVIVIDAIEIRDRQLLKDGCLCVRPTYTCHSSKHRALAESTIWRQGRFGFSGKILAMIALLWHLLGWFVSAFGSREGLI